MIGKRKEMYIYIARQPIFNADKTVEAYELLYRSSEKNAFDSNMDGNKATRKLLSQALIDFGMQAVSGGKKAYVNFTKQLLMANLPLLLDKQRFVLEILESVELSGEVIRRLRDYRAHGYILALDDYCGETLNPSVMSCMDIIKIDFLNTTKQARAQISKELLPQRKILLAEKVETKQEFEEAVALGCRLFQGYYLSKPLVLKKKAIQISQVSATRLFRMLSDGSYNIDKLTECVRVDAHLTYKLLQKMRTARYYRGNAITSVRDALVRLGMDEIRRWITLILMQDITDTDADEQIRMALIRAVFCEKMANSRGMKRLANDAFTIGIFSILDREGMEFAELLSILELSQQACDTLLYEKENDLTSFLQTAISYEEHQWDRLLEIYTERQMAELQKFYTEAIGYCNEAFSV